MGNVIEANHKAKTLHTITERSTFGTIIYCSKKYSYLKSLKETSRQRSHAFIVWMQLNLMYVKIILMPHG